MRVLDIDEFPQSGNYEAIGGFMMFMLRRSPKRTDSVKFSGYKFEVVDIDNYRIDQLLVTRLDNKATYRRENCPMRRRRQRGHEIRLPKHQRLLIQEPFFTFNLLHSARILPSRFADA